MRVFGFLSGLFDHISPAPLGGVCLFLFIIDFLIALHLKDKGEFVALASITGGICCIPSLLSPVFSDKDAAVWGVSTLVIGSTFYLLLDFILHVECKRLLKRKKAEQMARQAYFTLPDKENSFIRERLVTSLRANGLGNEEKYDNNEYSGEEYNLEESQLHLNHARLLLTKLKAAPLSPCDRLETDELSRSITFYATKNRLTATELRALNDCLSALLKKAAKYAL